MLHRIGGPAKEVFSHIGTTIIRGWYNYGKLHYLGGPALEEFSVDGLYSTTSYYLDGERISKLEHSRRIALQKLSTKARPDNEVFL